MKLKHLPLLGLLLFFLATTISNIYAQNDTLNISKDTLVVGLAGDQPFVIIEDENDGPQGIAVELWEELAENADWNYTYKSFSSVKEALEAVKNNKIDLIAGPLSITADRLENVSFSQPFYQSSLSILTHKEDGLWAQIKPLFSYKFFIAVAGFLFLLAMVGALFWLAERKVNPEEFSSKPTHGIGNGMWLAVVTMSTVGYGDMAPRSALGRILAGIWIVVTIVFATSMIAGIASVLTATGNSSEVTSAEDIPGRTIASLEDAPAKDFIKEQRGKFVGTKTLKEAIDLLKKNKVDAIVFDRPQLQYYIHNHQGEELYLPHAEYNKQGYGFAFPQGSDLVYEVNLKLLKLAENHAVKNIMEKFIGEEQ